MDSDDDRFNLDPKSSFNPKPSQINREMGEMVMDATNYDGAINYSTNWTLAGGSLTNSISFESSFSTTTANHESDDGINPAAVDHTAKSPLLLLPPVPNGDPCEITSTVLDPPFLLLLPIVLFFVILHDLDPVIV